MKKEDITKHGRFVDQYAEELPEITLGDHADKEEVDRQRIGLDTLSRYSNTEPDEFQPFILLTNFPHYVESFAQQLDVETHMGSAFRVAHCPAEKMSIIDYRVGAPMAALTVDVLSYTKPQCVIMLGLCGGLHASHRIGDFLIPMAAIRDEGASMHYMPPQVPSLPAFLVQQLVSQEIQAKGIRFKTGVIHTTDYRMWEFDKSFRQALRAEKATAIDMECSALFTAGFARKVPVGALMLISDLPLDRSGVKTKELAKQVISKYTDFHLECGIAALRRIRLETDKGDINLRRFHFDVA